MRLRVVKKLIQGHVARKHPCQILNPCGVLFTSRLRDSGNLSRLQGPVFLEGSKFTARQLFSPPPPWTGISLLLLVLPGWEGSSPSFPPGIALEGA